MNTPTLLEAAKTLRKRAEVYGLAGETNAPAVRCEVKGLTLGNWYDLDAAIAAEESKTTDRAWVLYAAREIAKATDAASKC